MNAKTQNLTVSETGQMILMITPPPGATPTLVVFRGGAQIASVDTRQYTFTLLPDDDYRFVVKYTFSLLGRLGVTSSPVGVGFRMVGPDGKKYDAVTPYTFDNLPAGRYTVTPAIIEDCYKTRDHSVVLKAGQRTVANFNVVCRDKTVDNVDRSRPTKRSLQNSVRVRESVRATGH